MSVQGLLLLRRGVLALPGLTLLGHARARAAQGGPFSLGIASGEPAPDGFVLWTRLAFDWRGGGIAARAVPVDWVVARDEALRDVVRRGQAVATPRRYVVKAGRTALPPG
ncbi:PhoD-like phosphatase N-terminal domain-containing protein [Pararoseomonas indoligenes]|uniref:PhoD-like phosphatase N-terminal domain-containing protein n=1 Tax=Roseomonas indoligenes TaxID=2820811 RepID=A0A940N0V2_9PROT|nr:PhoD-like phosphatase N-terminal domain-containing protein [Pararoseomonas indoligenes]MBP0494469.1 PhoD-like phosphatase N-terminal domain-containing protein [Pararoseomonas indoligenes]